MEYSFAQEVEEESRGGGGKDVLMYVWKDKNHLNKKS